MIAVYSENHTYDQTTRVISDCCRSNSSLFLTSNNLTVAHCVEMESQPRDVISDFYCKLQTSLHNNHSCLDLGIAME
jgi:hypothetical protein